MARKLAEENQVADRVTFLESDLAVLDASLGPFDVIIGMIYNNDPGLTGPNGRGGLSHRKPPATKVGGVDPTSRAARVTVGRSKASVGLRMPDETRIDDRGSTRRATLWRKGS